MNLVAIYSFGRFISSSRFISSLRLVVKNKLSCNHNIDHQVFPSAIILSDTLLEETKETIEKNYGGSILLLL
jgi:hypothetical protein